MRQEYGNEIVYIIQPPPRYNGTSKRKKKTRKKGTGK